MLTFQTIFDSVSPGDISALEGRLGVTFPGRYREFLAARNGGQPAPNEFYIPGVGESALVDLLYGIGPTRRPGDLEYENGQVADQLPEGFLVIGHDPGANYLMLETVADKPGRIYYWDASHFFDTSDESQNTYPIADGIDELLASLK